LFARFAFVRFALGVFLFRVCVGAEGEAKEVATRFSA
jgi:hypothetical protein